MTSELAFKPYTGNTKPFAIGLKPLPADWPWLTVNDRYARYCTEKADLLQDRASAVFRAEPDTLEVQNKVLDRLLARLTSDYPGLIAIDGDQLISRETGKTYYRSQWQSRPLALAGLLVQEDLVIMRQKPGGWSLAAAFVAFPSSWLLAEKFGRSMAEIHAPIPGMPGRQSQMIERIFDNLRPGLPVYRQNWSLYDDDQLHHPRTENARGHPWHAAGQDPLDALFVRIEHQTLTRLSASDILFTILISVDPLKTIFRHADCASLAAGLARQISELTAPQLFYKGLTDTHKTIVERLRAVAESVPVTGD